MSEYEIKIGRLKKRVRIIRDPNLIDAEIERFRLYLKAKEDLKRIDQELEKQKEIEKQAEIAQLKKELEEQKKIQHERWLKEKPEVRYFQEFTLANESQVIELDMSRIVEDAVPISIAKEQIQTAYEDGQTDGNIAARAEFRTEIEKYQKWLRRIEETAENLRLEHYEQLEKNGETIVELAMIIAERVLYHELDVNKNSIVHRVKGILDELKNEQIFKIDINPESVDVLRQAGSELVENPEESQKIIINGNPTVPVGSAILETSAGFIDARLKNQLNRMRESLDEEQNRIFETKEMQDKVNEVYEEKSTEDDFGLSDQMLDEFPEPVQTADPNQEINIDEIPEQYKEFFEEDDFGSADIDNSGMKLEDDFLAKYEEQKKSEEEEAETFSKIDYEKEYEEYLEAQEKVEETIEIEEEEIEEDFNLYDETQFDEDQLNDGENLDA